MIPRHLNKWMFIFCMCMWLSNIEIVYPFELTNLQSSLNEQYLEKQIIETDSFRIILPRQIHLWCGYREIIPLKIENRTDQNKNITIKAKTKVNIFINGITSDLAVEDIAVNVAEVNIFASETKEENLEIQSLRVGRYDLAIIIDNQEIGLVVNSQLKERGAYFMYRCWFEGAEFFDTVWSDGKAEIGARQRRIEEKDLLQKELQNGKSKEEAAREAHRKIWEKYKIITYKKLPDWKDAYGRKKNQHTGTCGFQYIDIDGLGWSEIECQKGKYDWTLSDFMIDLSNRYFYGEPFARLEIAPQWAEYERGPSGRWGFYDPNNELLMNHWEKYCEALAERYDGDGKDDAPGSPIIKHFILNNEPVQYWFSVDFDKDGWAVSSGQEGIAPTRWFRDALKRGGWEEVKRVYTGMFGDLLFEVTKRAAEAIHRANPQARVCTPQFVPGGYHLYAYEYILDKGIGKYIDAWGQHPGNAFNLHTLWKKNPDVNYVVEDAANQSPPFEVGDLTRTYGVLDRKGQLLKTARPAEEIIQENPYMGKLWRRLIDEPYSQPLEELTRLLSRYNLNLPVWVTEEIMIGPLATNRRENLIAALREYSIVFHLKVEITTMASVISVDMMAGDTKVSYLPDPIAKELIIDIGKAIGGAVPVEKFDCRWFMPQDDEYLDYSNTVYKLFNRGEEDIIALWSNSGKEEMIEFDVNPEANIHQVKLIEFDADEGQFKSEKKLNKFPQNVKVKPLKEFYFISVKSDKPQFGWLKNIQRRISDEGKELISLCNKTRKDITRLKDKLRTQVQRDDLEQLRRIPQALNQTEDDIAMGYYTKAREELRKIQRFILDFKSQNQVRE